MPHELSLPQLQEDVYQALKAWYNTEGEVDTLPYLQLYRQALLAGDSTAREATNQVLLNALETLEVEHVTQVQLLQSAFSMDYPCTQPPISSI